jgi:predicted HTH transcriptional regulator
VRLEPEELARRIRKGEGKDLEFKRGLPGDAKVARTLCAFANTRGGLLLIGVGDKRELVGAPRPKETIERLRLVAAELLEPALAVELGIVVLAERRIVWCSVPISPARPHAVRGEDGLREVVARVGASNRRASGGTLASIRAQRASGASLDPLQRQILAWLASGPAEPTVPAFCAARNIGTQRARRAFTQLELAGRLVAHGSGARRVFALP